ncbi:MAG: Nif3-like dinuclear metal center hexameric protein [Candidatus Thiodiazotropha sp. (ex Semelilucina semeliformis)]|nr:Nif3-like dinuclear metal center hexameric protein [Candidatus Thiodiazotropha sp. (ex Semelilucina semeliformis)]
MIDLLTLEAYTNQLLAVDAFEDYCPNGLQVEAGGQVNRLMVGVTACQALIDTACEWKADLLLVHHGFFWKGEPASIRGMKGRRIVSLIDGRVSLLAYHLPLDAHTVYGNNAQLGKRLGFEGAVATEERDGLIWSVELPEPMQPEDLTERITQALGRKPLHIPGHQRPLRRIGWCTGAAQSYLETAAAMGLDAFISGEISEPTVHMAREMAVDYFAAGHHATERFGVQALGQHLAEQFGLVYRFVDIENPV